MPVITKSPEIQLYNLEEIKFPKDFPTNGNSSIGKILDSIGNRWGANILLASDIYRKPHVLRFDDALYDFTSRYNTVPTLQQVPQSNYNWLWFRGKATCFLTLKDMEVAQEKAQDPKKNADFCDVREIGQVQKRNRRMED